MTVLNISLRFAGFMWSVVYKEYISAYGCGYSYAILARRKLIIGIEREELTIIGPKAQMPSLSKCRFHLCTKLLERAHQWENSVETFQ
jgi:hypothetical protein